MEQQRTQEKVKQKSSSKKKAVLKPKGPTKIALHSIHNILGDQRQLSLFRESAIAEFTQEYGIKLENSIDRFGITLTDVQMRVMEAILHGFTETNYQGNASPKDRKEIAEEKYASRDLPAIYKNTMTIPRLVVTQSQIMEWAGLNTNSIADKERGVEAIRYLGKTQFCFYYNRLAIDGDGLAKKNRSGGWVKEEVTAVDTLFTIKEIRNEQTKALQHYEIFPSPIFLDQRESYFLLIPSDWREEVEKAIGKKKISSYNFRFLLFLRYQYELKRRARKPLEIRWVWEEIAKAIKMPEIVYKRNKERAHKILEEAYLVAKTLGYLKDYERGDLDTLILREEKYYKPEHFLSIDENIKPIPIASEEAKKLFDFFYSERKKIDSGQKIPMGEPKNIHLRALDKLLSENRSVEEIEEVIRWGMSNNFWWVHLATPSKLYNRFGEAFGEMRLGNKSNKTEDNQRYAQEMIIKVKKKIPMHLRIECLSKEVEFVSTNSNWYVIISYDDTKFKEKFNEALMKNGVMD